MHISNILHCRNILGEGPLWNPDENALYWVDINAKKVQRYYPDGGKSESFDMPLMVSVLGMRLKGGFVCGTENGFYFWEPTNNHWEFITNPEKGKLGARFNDGKVDRMGRFWAGTMTPQGSTSSLYRLDPDLTIHHMLSDITISNGIGWSGDNRTMYYVDSNCYVIYAFDFDLKSGEISRQRIFKRFSEGQGVPDGLTVDSEDYVWCAIYDGWKIVRLNPQGEIVLEVPMPVSRPSSVAFGGKNLDRLFVTSISEGLSPTELKEQPMAGDLFVIEADVSGLPEPKFAG